MSLRYPRAYRIHPGCPTPSGSTLTDLARATGTRPVTALLPPLRAGGLAVDTERRTVSAGGRELPLTYAEFEILARLIARPRQVHTRRQLLASIWGQGHESGTRTIDVHIAGPRRKLGPDHQDVIRTVRQAGYVLDPSGAAGRRCGGD
ncbi:winged helix-turn-helix domain-containing protein [Streptomyces sp. NPDC020379]|uniref:winged helix-turn-helix domain-containing protein n=1 Tax=Streptomyces sp. NPDC020379 TaxID=3365071 RepID=UPI0037A67453